MEQKKNFVQQMIRQAAQRMLQREYSEWPPTCWSYLYQLRRPDTPLATFSDGTSDEKAK